MAEKNNKKSGVIRSYQEITVKSDEFKRAAKFGFVDDNGSVFLKIDGDDILIDKIYVKDINLTAAKKDDILLKYVKAYYELASSIDYLNNKIQTLKLSEKDLDESIKILEKKIENPDKIIGSLEALKQDLSKIKDRIPEIKKEFESRKKDLLEEEKQKRLSIAENIKRIANKKYEDFNQFRSAENKIEKQLLKWNALRAANIYNVHLDKATCDKIWQTIYDARKALNDSKKSFYKQHKQTEKRIKDEKKLLIDKVKEINASSVEGAEAKVKEYFESWKKLTSSYKLHSHVTNNRLWKHFKKELDVFYDSKRKVGREEYLSGLNDFLSFFEVCQIVNLFIKSEKELDVKTVSKYVNIAENAFNKFANIPVAKQKRAEGLLKSLKSYIAKAKKAEWDKNDPEKIERANSFANLVLEKNKKIEEMIKACEKAGKTEEIKALKNQIEINNKMLSVVKK